MRTACAGTFVGRETARDPWSEEESGNIEIGMATRPAAREANIEVPRAREARKGHQESPDLTERDLAPLHAHPLDGDLINLVRTLATMTNLQVRLRGIRRHANTGPADPVHANVAPRAGSVLPVPNANRTLRTPTALRAAPTPADLTRSNLYLSQTGMTSRIHH